MTGANNLERLHDRYKAIRARTLELIEPLTAEDCAVQSMPDASPAKWHLAHTTWFFETFVLGTYERGFAPFHPEYRVLFNSYYHGIGERFPRPYRGLLTRPPLKEVLDYRAHVDRRMLNWLSQGDYDTAAQALITLGLHHEQQHQELLLTDIKHLLSCNPLAPAYRADASPPMSREHPVTWLPFEGGLVNIGHHGDDFSFDNETPRHRVFLAPYQLASRLVTNGELAQFMAAGGYETSSYWLAEGWDWRTKEGIHHPMYWRDSNADHREHFTLSGSLPVDPHGPALHLSYYEADALARWADARLPTEAEWEFAAASIEGHDHESEATEWFGTAWQWTQSSYAPYPGFRPAPGAVGEYNGKFMVNQYVLRGSSLATPVGHARLSYRNFFPATARWQFSGVRLARDAA